MEKKICLITGGNRGIGKAAALALVKRGASVIISCRDADSGAQARDEIIRVTGSSDVSVETGDLSERTSIDALAARLTDLPRLDVLVNNAAVFTNRRETTAAGLELMFAVNHMGVFWLTNALLPLLKASPQGRIITVTAPSTISINFDDPQGKQKWSALQAFGATKMCNLLFTYALARRLRDSHVTANAIHPGIIKTDLMRAAPAPLRWLTALTGAQPQKAGEAIASLALDEAFIGVTGKFFREGKEIISNAYSNEESVQERLWMLSAV